MAETEQTITERKGQIIGQAELPTATVGMSEDLRDEIERGETVLIVDVAGNKFTEPANSGSLDRLDEARLWRARMDLKRELDEADAQRVRVLIDNEAQAA
ncbi:MAG: hypothetical protein HYV38_01970 [Candidatus Levybacteria bacterium]|nr:hypothetical protein [Candidatus Levybacteria bacterium]MBI2420827.1 hypothetical protein [Candidatus Levybacteria bacterium]